MASERLMWCFAAAASSAWNSSAVSRTARTCIRCGPTPGSAASSTPELVDVVAGLGLVRPLLDLLPTHYLKLVWRAAGNGHGRPDNRPVRASRSEAPPR
jgi:hypothetical protein